jgi:hypothetical protein
MILHIESKTGVDRNQIHLLRAIPPFLFTSC